MSMRTYRVTVNGVTYDVEVEQIGGGAGEPAAYTAPAAQEGSAQTAPAQTPSAQAASASGAAGSVAVKAPMPGTVLKTLVKPGDTVKKDDVLVVLEAMKMESDIVAPQDGTVATVPVSAGATVNTDDVLVTMN